MALTHLLSDVFFFGESRNGSERNFGCFRPYQCERYQEDIPHTVFAADDGVVLQSNCRDPTVLCPHGRLPVMTRVTGTEYKVPCPEETFSLNGQFEVKPL